MIIIVSLVNIIIAGLVFFMGILYPSIKDWSYNAIGLIGFFLMLEIVVIKATLLDAAKISAWTINALSTVISLILLLPYKLGWADWWGLLVAFIVGCNLLIVAVIVLVFKHDGVADLKPNNATIDKDLNNQKRGNL